MWIDLPVGVSVGSRTPHLIFCIPGLVDALVLTGSGRCNSEPMKMTMLDL